MRRADSSDILKHNMRFCCKGAKLSHWIVGNRQTKTLQQSTNANHLMFEMFNSFNSKRQYAIVIVGEPR